jgi:hypothetical protein
LRTSSNYEEGLLIVKQGGDPALLFLLKKLHNFKIRDNMAQKKDNSTNSANNVEREVYIPDDLLNSYERALRKIDRALAELKKLRPAPEEADVK